VRPATAPTGWPSARPARRQLTNLVATASGSTDAEGDTFTYTYEWAKMGVGSSTWDAWGNAGATLGKSKSAKGEKWKLTPRVSMAGSTGPGKRAVQ